MQHLTTQHGLRLSPAQVAMVEKLREALAAEWPATGSLPTNSDAIRTAIHQSFESRFGAAALANVLTGEGAK